MPETASLHIRDRGLKTTRVVALSGDYVRIGRSPICDVLILDPNIARVECHLSREGDIWTITPERPDGRVWHQGARLGGALVLKEGQTITVGENIVTFHQVGYQTEVSDTEPVDEVSPEPLAVPEPVAPEPVAAAAMSVEPADDSKIEILEPGFDSENPSTNTSPGAALTSRAEIHQHLLQTRAETKKWESRWRSVGERLKESSVAAGAAPRKPIGTSFAPPADGRGQVKSVSTPPPAAPRVAQRLAERPLPSASRVTREIRETPARARVASPVTPVGRPPAPAAVPSYDSPRPRLAPSLSPYRSESPRKPAEPSPTLAPTARLAEPVAPYRAEPLETRIEPSPVPEPVDEVSRNTVQGRGMAFLVESIIDDEEETTRDYEAPAQRTLGATRRLTTPRRNPDTVFSPSSSSAFAFDSEAPITAVSSFEHHAESLDLDLEMESELFSPVVAPIANDIPVFEPASSIEPEPTPEPLQTKNVFDEVREEPETLAPHDPFVTDTFRRDPLVWQESTVAATPFQMPSYDAEKPRRPRKEESSSERFESSDANPRHDGFHRSYLDQEPAAGARREPLSSRDWPSVSDIFANRPPRRDVPQPRRVKSKVGTARPRPEPTVAREPSQWTVPLWVGWLPATAVSLFILASFVGINWFWTVDNYNAGMVARRLDPKAGATKPLAEGVEPSPTQWWRTSANHLLTWVRYLDRADNDPSQLAESRELLQKASEISPLSPTIRHAAAMAAADPKEHDPYALAKAVGQSRDILTLTHAGGQLLRAGKMKSAREAYRMALEMAAKTDPNQPISPLLDGAQIRRYTLPTEDLLAPVIRDMARQDLWTFEDWSSAIPRHTVAPLVAARVLRDLRHRDAKAALELARGDAISETLIAGSTRSENTMSAILLAAEAEALAMDDKPKEALECYRSAIERMPIDRVVRSWWLNLAELARRLNQDSERRKALELAKCDDPKDEITLQAIELQKDAGDFIGQTVDKGKKDPETRAASTTVE